MSNKNSTSKAAFNATQLSLAGTQFEDALAALERDTIGAYYNQRQRDLLLILSAKYKAEMDGEKVDYLVKEKFEHNIADHLGVSAGTIKNDLKAMGVLVHTPFINGGKRDKAYKLTEEGYALFCDYTAGKAQLVLDTAKAIRQADEGSKHIADSNSKPVFATKLFAVITAAFLTLSATWQAEASELVQGIHFPQANQISDYPSSHMIPLTYTVPLEASSRFFSSANTGATAPATKPWTIAADRKSMFDEHLPRLISDVIPGQVKIW